MTLVNGAFSTQKTDLYRSSVGQRPLTMSPNQDAAIFCQNMVNVQTPFLAKNQATLQNGQTPVPAVGTNLFTFMANRLNMSFTNLNCKNFGLKNPVQVTLDGNGAATAATLNTTQQKANAGAGRGTNPIAPTQPNKGQNPRQQGQVPSNQG